MALFHQNYTFDGKNEQAIREELIRPFLTELGYTPESDTLVRYEVPLRYEYHFLGRKKPGKDIKIEGRSDYIVEVIPAGRWVIEAKPPSEALTVEHSHQAHTYAAHPEIAAILYLITNGREWKLYRTSYPDNPIAEWQYVDIDKITQNIQNVLSPSAIRRLNKFEIDLSKPIAKGLRSKLEIKTGYVVYEEHKFQHKIFEKGSQEGIQNGITGEGISRADNGEIVAVVSFLSAYGTMQQYFSAMGIDRLEFRTVDEYISDDRSRPTVFTNLTRVSVPKGNYPPPCHGPNSLNPWTDGSR
ncbi:hypothetical protein Sa4125_35470 [Aureimonas sp. SA4125]|uniref:type I restriction enzyme HsdR N-terminal domain-containing protein n=1 Tax=Aureimonas sp. SA4125 TaxID=2826993 RepID=UPI001CC3470B|nr:type I restriction enzyme HsdR N-terminal domain-containing protein [Aureimonas sp. SA4125]BDA86005.1 hypothetical protein Sa4125_35470 [Aureimonas sp. SA4125]